MTAEPDATRSRDPRLLTVLWMAIGCGILMVALVFRVDNSKFGFGLILVGIASLVLAVAHRWRHPKPFLILAAVSVIGFPVLSVLHNLFYGIAELAHDTPVVRWPMEALHVGCFLLALLVCPAAGAVGVVGSLVTLIRARRRT